MTLSLSVRHRLGAASLDLAFESGAGITALFGRSGAGKTSIMRLVAGLLRPDEGRISFDGETLVDTQTRRFLPAHRRGFATVFQEARLFPHLSVRRNLAYGRWLSRVRPNAAEFDRVVDLLGIAPLLSRRPEGLSGGEKQRVAIGRALLAAPRMLLMDEPLAALDEARKAEILPFLERLRDQTAIPILYVSHSVAEVSRLADRVLLIEDGRLAGSGTATEMLSLPSASHGIDRREEGTVVEAVVEAEQPDPRLTRVRAGALQLRLPRRALVPGQGVRLRIAARDVLIATQRPEGLSALNSLAGTITGLAPAGANQVDVMLDCSGTRLSARITDVSCDLLALAVGQRVHAVIKTVALDP
ncbi:molybdenum ABC transporter ATP-binding protein [Rhizobium sp. CC-YZS058]|uniref:molybdenum ABC transporter ATP-binding protein n=1 Tax=Rhizobium sp. CC-YZS058 TaxID=3042153 RepID=UPI002B0598F8|nr:molybdenum ABC transporter ATP-binding protein [Rhizobium sp. CC-YZS058]MEA3533481.1 molybdenum ABC transporter ATP-binding protein [Rhizobium sp. CC-YZS058]